MNPPSNLLLVEGATEKRVIPELMERRGVTWEPQPKDFAVTIREYGGFENMIAPNELEAAMKASGLKSLGFIFDCDGLHDTSNRLIQVQTRLRGLGIEIPNPLPPEGFITKTSSGEIDFGVWMMPNNTDKGMLETFLMNLVPESASGLYRYVVDCAEESKNHGATYKECHKHKALIHTFLAWLDEPGPQLHEAVKFKMLDTSDPYADSFSKWFRSLFSV